MQPMALRQPMPTSQTTVVVMGGGMGQQSFQPGPWVESFCGCCSDIASCLMAWCCPCIQYGINYEAIHHSGCLLCGCVYCCLRSCNLQCCVHMGLRGNIRQKFNIYGGGLEDCCLTWCCPCCALAQEAREIKIRRHEAAVKGIPW